MHALCLLLFAYYNSERYSIASMLGSYSVFGKSFGRLRGKGNIITKQESHSQTREITNVYENKFKAWMQSI